MKCRCDGGSRNASVRGVAFRFQIEVLVEAAQKRFWHMIHNRSMPL